MVAGVGGSCPWWQARAMDRQSQDGVAARDPGFFDGFNAVGVGRNLRKIVRKGHAGGSDVEREATLRERRVCFGVDLAGRYGV